jgi:hypothetical protein
MKSINRTAGLAAAASLALALALATVACGEGSGSIVNPTRPAPAPAPAPVATFIVSGTVSEATETGSVALEGASIVNLDTESSAVTDSEGSYRLAGLHAGMARFVISKEGYQDGVVEMMIEGDAQLDAVLVRSESN